jgi:hypothetical protein
MSESSATPSRELFCVPSCKDSTKQLVSLHHRRKQESDKGKKERDILELIVFLKAGKSLALYTFSS